METLDPVTIQVGGVYSENPKTLPDYTTYVNGTVDTSTPGVYTINYTLIQLDPVFDTKTYSREVTVTAVPPNSVTISLNGDAVISVPLADVAAYSDAGATSSDGTVFVTNLDGTSSESFTGLPNVAGSYTLIYYVSGAISNFVTRTIHVLGQNVPPAVDLPALGPTNVNAEVNSPIEGPTNLNAELAVTKPSVGYPVESVENVPVPDNPPIKPSVGYPVESVENVPVPDNSPIKPDAGFPIESAEDTTVAPPDNSPIKPAVGYPIQSTEDTTVVPPDNSPIKPSTGYPIESAE